MKNISNMQKDDHKIAAILYINKTVTRKLGPHSLEYRESSAVTATSTGLTTAATATMTIGSE